MWITCALKPLDHAVNLLQQIRIWRHIVSKKKKIIAGNQGAIRHRLATSDIARYKLWNILNIFHLKYFPQLQCAAGWPALP